MKIFIRNRAREAKGNSNDGGKIATSGIRMAGNKRSDIKNQITLFLVRSVIVHFKMSNNKITLQPVGLDARCLCM